MTKKNAHWIHLYGWVSEDTIQSMGRKQLPECLPLFTERDNEIWGGGGGGGRVVKPYIVKVLRKPKYSFPESTRSGLHKVTLNC